MVLFLQLIGWKQKEVGGSWAKHKSSEQVFGQYSKRQHSMLMQMRLRIGIGLQKKISEF